MKQNINATSRLALWALSGLLMATWLVGCSSPFAPRETKSTQTYLLEWTAPTTDIKLNASGPTLLVSPVRAAAGFGSSDMLYVKQTHQLERFAHHRWADAPARMLEPLLIRACEQSGLLRAVAGAGKQLQAGLRLDSELLQLQQVFGGPGSQIELTLRVALVDVASGKLLATANLSFTESADENTPYAGVLAANRAVGQLLEQVQGFLAEELTTNSPS